MTGWLAGLAGGGVGLNLHSKAASLSTTDNFSTHADIIFPLFYWETRLERTGMTSSPFSSCRKWKFHRSLFFMFFLIEEIKEITARKSSPRPHLWTTVTMDFSGISGNYVTFSLPGWQSVHIESRSVFILYSRMCMSDPCIIFHSSFIHLYSSILNPLIIIRLSIIQLKLYNSKWAVKLGGPVWKSHQKPKPPVN